tara:strand:+ start:531 stop:725 length:195 start_codon:yes stop_codon:yes gene_type:complete
MMDQQTKLIIALNQVDNITKLTEDNEYKTYLYSHLSTIKYELERQLTNLADQSKIKEQTTEDDD